MTGAGARGTAANSGEGVPEAARRRAYPVRAPILGLVLVLAIPLNTVIALTIWNLARSARDSQLQALGYSAQSIASAVDASVGKYIALVDALSRSPALAAGDLDAFHAEAVRTVQLDGAWAIVADSSGQMLINTRRPVGQPLPVRAPEGRAYQARAAELGKTVVSGVYKGLIAKTWIVSVENSVAGPGGTRYAMAVVVPASTFLGVLNPDDIPRGWLAGIMDGAGRYLARLPDPEQTTGALASQGWRALAGVEGLSEFASREGDSIFNANAVSKLTDWTIGVGVRKSQLDAAVIRDTNWYIGLALFVSLGSIVLALALGRWIARSTSALSAAAAALLRGGDPSFHAEISEFDALWGALRQTAAEKAKSDALVAESEKRLRRASEAARFGVHELNPGSGVAVWSDQMNCILGTSPHAVAGLATFFRSVHPSDRTRVREEVENVQRRVGPYELTMKIVRPGGEIRWVVDKGEAVGPIDPATGLVSRVTGTLVDATDRKRAEERNDLLVREVSHRSKNLMSVILALARRTDAASVPGYIDRFASRLRALASNQDLLVGNNWQGISLAELVKGQLSPFGDFWGNRLRVDGPDIAVTPDAAQAIGMALHELATNAVKYGALSNDAGVVRVSWRVADDRLEIEWVETGGPPVETPTKNGFGTTIMTSLAQMALGGEAALSFCPGGLVWSLRCPAKSALGQE